MNTFQKQIHFFKEDRRKREEEVIILSNRIAGYIGLLPEEVEHGTIFNQVPGYRITSESRCFSRGWVRVFEITTERGSMEWANWEGTVTINCPPEEVVKDFFKKLDRVLS